MKIATHLLFFNQDNFILKNIEMIAPFVDKIYVTWSEFPWLYNLQARDLFKNKSNPELLKQSPYYDKIELIIGEWNLDEDQRNACLDAAKRDEMDYLFGVDFPFTENKLNKNNSSNIYPIDGRWNDLKGGFIWSISWYMLTKNIVIPTYKPKGNIVRTI